MKLAIMQPYLFPYVGYFQLMAYADRWVVFDDVQFINKGWVNRNRILHPDVSKGWQFITLPLDKRRRFDGIGDVRIKADGQWQGQILGKLSAYRRKAPHYDATLAFVRECLDTDETNLSRFVVRCLRLTARRLGITTPIDVQSQLQLTLRPVEHAGQWALRISEALGASEYINPHGGTDIFDPKEFEQAGIALRFLRPRLSPYVQRRGHFVPGLSILDVMMWNSLEAIAEQLAGDYDVLEPSMAG